MSWDVGGADELRSNLRRADEALVRVCVSDAEHSAAAWNAWISAAKGLPDWAEQRYPRHWRDLLPLAGYRQRQLSLGAPAWLISKLKMAAVLEERRLPVVYETTADIISHAELAQHNPLVIGGLAIGETAYPHPATRHTGVLSLVLADGTKLRPIRRQLIERGYRVQCAGLRSLHLPWSAFARLRLRHPSGFQLLILSAAGRSRLPLTHAALRERAQTVRVADGLEFLAPAPEDGLALIGEGEYGEQDPNSLVSSVDAALLARLVTDLAVASTPRSSSTPAASGMYELEAPATTRPNRGLGSGSTDARSA